MGEHIYSYGETNCNKRESRNYYQIWISILLFLTTFSSRMHTVVKSFPLSKENRKGVSKHAKEIKFQVCRGGGGGERNTCSQFNFLRYYNVTLVVYSPNSTSLTFIIYIFREWKSASSRPRYVTRGDRNLLNRWSPLVQGRETRFRYPCYRHNPPSQFIRCSILDILSLSNFLRLSRIFVISFDDDVTMIRTIMI